jgi:outer membrane lipoprotein-sorting protein
MEASKMAKLAVLMVACALAAWSAATAPPPSESDAEQVLQRLRDAYQRCATYRDRGVLREEYDIGELHHIQEITFQTAFARPDRFRLEFRTPKPFFGTHVHIIWADGDEVRTWWDVTGGEVERESLRMALAAAAGISSRLSSRVPTLLMPVGALGGGIQLADVARDGDEPIDGRMCIRVSGRQATMPSSIDVGGRTVSVEDGGMVLWIDPETLLLRRVETVVVIDGNRTVTTTTYEAAVDEALDETLLAYSPPGATTSAP